MTPIAPATPDSSTPSTSSTPLTSPSPEETSGAPRRARLNALRHGLTGQVFLLNEAESVQYIAHHHAIREYYQPVGPIETALTDQISVGIWRLQRCAAIEEAMFAVHAPVVPDVPQTLNRLIGPGGAWLEQSKSLSLLSTYEGRIRRALDKDKAELTALQQTRKADAAKAMDQAVALHDLAKKQGKRFQPERYFPTAAPATADSVFSTDKVESESARRQAWTEARTALAKAA